MRSIIVCIVALSLSTTSAAAATLRCPLPRRAGARIRCPLPPSLTTMSGKSTDAVPEVTRARRLTIQEPDCPDGNCPTPDAPRWQPFGGRFRLR